MLLNTYFKISLKGARGKVSGKETGQHTPSGSIVIAASVAGRVIFSSLVVPAAGFEYCNMEVQNFFLDSSQKASKCVTIPTPFVEDTTFSPKAL